MWAASEMASLRGKRLWRPNQQLPGVSFRAGIARAAGGRLEEAIQDLDRRRVFSFLERRWRRRAGLEENNNESRRSRVASEEEHDVSEEESNSSDYEREPFDSVW